MDHKLSPKGLALGRKPGLPRMGWTLALKMSLDMKVGGSSFWSWLLRRLHPSFVHCQQGQEPHLPRWLTCRFQGLIAEFMVQYVWGMVLGSAF